MEQLKHECGIALLRLKKPLPFYREKYGTRQYALNKLYLLMEKQHNRGQEGAGIGCVSAGALPGTEYIFRERAEGTDAIGKVFDNARRMGEAFPQDMPCEAVPFCGEAYMGHLRYSTTGKHGLAYVHPFLRRNNWRNRSLLLCGNFNLTNTDEVFNELVSEGQHPRLYSDTFMMLERLGSYLDQGYGLTEVLRRSARSWDGGYVICGITGTAEMFAFRDPWGIRPAFYYHDDEIAVVASERPVIQTVFDLETEAVQELMPGQGFLVDATGHCSLEQIQEPRKITPCSFERIYFSRGSDRDIYRERKTLGRMLVGPVWNAIDGDIENTVFSFIPNTAEVAFLGMMEGFGDRLREWNLPFRLRQEKVAIKDIKLRTFIAEDNSRNDLAAHVYDITYGSLRPYTDNLVVIDDSIVRGTTLKQSIIRILDRLHPKKIVIVSSSPQVRYPDCYGIDMSRMEDFAAFRAAISLLEERNMLHLLDEIYEKCKKQENLPKEQITNEVKAVYKPFTAEEIAGKMALILTPEEVKTKVQIVFQSIEGIHEACPDHQGDWYFTGNYPTPGGNKVVNAAFISFYEKLKIEN